MTILHRKSVRWFLGAGCIGLVVAVVISIIKPTHPAIVLFLWPTAILGLANPTRFLDQLVAAILIFGGNFLLYGAFGAVAGIAAGRLQR
jgi:hypothetical protein